MTDQVSSQAQQMSDAWKKAVEDQVGRMESAFAEAARLQAAGVEQMTGAIDQMAKLQKDTLGYMTQLADEWRKLSLDAARRATSAIAPKG